MTRRMPIVKATAREQAAAAKVSLKTKIAFMDAIHSPEGIRLVSEAARIVGISVAAGWGIMHKPPTGLQRGKLEVSGLPLETRQAFLDAMKEGKTLGEARAATGISERAAFTLFRSCFKRHTIYTMNYVAK